MKTSLQVKLIIILSVLLFSMGGSACSAETLPAGAPDVVEIYAPASTSSIPVLLAASQSAQFHVTLYDNQSQANTLFLRGEVPMLITGLSVGQDLYAQEVPIRMANSFVSGLSYVVTYGKQIDSFADLAGGELYVPFEGSPIEEISAYFAAQEGLVWGEDITPVYSPFDSSVALLKEGKATAVVLPEPFVSLLEGQPDLYISLDYAALWDSYNPDDMGYPLNGGYPQVGTFVNTAWAADNAEGISAWNEALAQAIADVQSDPQAAVSAVSTYYKFPEAVLLKSLNRIGYNLSSGADLQALVEQYDEIIGNTSHEDDADFYYLAEK
jgi:NitT/TauT family transport system substrate-binding protein